MERKLIYADELEEKLLKMGFHPALVRGMLENMKTVDAVEVVRCKNCKWQNRAGCAIYVVDNSDTPKENDFCSFGERRADNGC